MKKVFNFCVLIVLLNLIGANIYAQKKLINSIWLTQDKDAKVQFFKKAGKIFGKIVWLKKPLDIQGDSVVDCNNPETLLASRKLMNLVVIKDLKKEEDQWVDGTLYDPTDGGTYDCKMWLEDENTLKVRGYLGFLYETETWIKTNL